MTRIPTNNLYRHTGLALQMLVIILAGVLGGLKLDRWLKLGIPLCTIIFSALSIGLAIYVAVREMDKKNNK